MKASLKKSISVLLSLILILSIVPVNVIASTVQDKATNDILSEEPDISSFSDSCAPEYKVAAVKIQIQNPLWQA